MPIHTESSVIFNSYITLYEKTGTTGLSGYPAGEGWEQ